MENVWRDDNLSPGQSPTASMVVCCAEDSIGSRRGVELRVIHVRTINGRGFMPRVLAFGSMTANGDVFLGEDAEAREKAKKSGLDLFEREHAMIHDDD